MGRLSSETSTIFSRRRIPEGKRGKLIRQKALGDREVTDLVEVEDDRVAGEIEAVVEAVAMVEEVVAVMVVADWSGYPLLRLWRKGSHPP